MAQTANRRSKGKSPHLPEHDNCTHYSIYGAAPPEPQGRLVLVLENELSSASRATLHRLLTRLMQYQEVTMISGLRRASMLQAEALGNGLFYNRREYLSPETAFKLMPWREIWLVAGDRVWALHAAG